MGMYYSDGEPEEGIAPKPGLLPTIEMEARGESIGERFLVISLA